MCILPIRIINKRLDFTSAIHRKFIDVPCGKCAQCRDNQINGVASRISQMVYDYPQNAFLTFTYNNDSLPRTWACDWIPNSGGRPCFYQPHITDLLRKLRDKFNEPKASHIAYSVFSEYGHINGRPHYHMMLHVDDTLNIDDVVEYARKVWTGQSTPINRYKSEPWKYGNLGFMFPSKADVKLGKHLLRDSGKASCYAAKYATKDMSFIGRNEDLYKDRWYRRACSGLFPASHFSRYYGLSIKDEKSLNLVEGTYINPLTNKPNLIPLYVLEYLKYKRVFRGEVNGMGVKKYSREKKETYPWVKLLDAMIYKKTMALASEFGLEKARKIAIWDYVYRMKPDSLMAALYDMGYTSETDFYRPEVYREMYKLDLIDNRYDGDVKRDTVYLYEFSPSGTIPCPDDRYFEYEESIMKQRAIQANSKEMLRENRRKLKDLIKKEIRC